MMKITGMPLSVINRALELFGEAPERDFQTAQAALLSAEGRHDAPYELPGITPLAQAVAEYLSLSGPWNEDHGECAGESGYQIAD